MKIPSDFQNHLIHCIQEEHGIQLSNKAIMDIKNTINGAYQAAAYGAIQKQKAADTRYYEQKNITEFLLNKIFEGETICKYGTHPVQKVKNALSVGG